MARGIEAYVVRPVSPGEVLAEKILAGGLTQDKLATALGVSRLSVNQIVKGRRSVTAEMALRLAKVTTTTAEFWLNLQMAVDVYDAKIAMGDVVDRLPVLRGASEVEIVEAGEF